MYAKATLRSRSTTLHSGRLTRAIRFVARLAPHPNFAPFSRKTSYSPDVVEHLFRPKFEMDDKKLF